MHTCVAPLSVLLMYLPGAPAKPQHTPATTLLRAGNVLLKSARSDRRGFTARVSDFGFNKNKLLYDECDRASPTLDRASPTLDRNSPQAPVSAQHVATLTHTAPEAVDGQLQKASDVYSFGIIMWEMVSGTPPFADMHWAAMMSVRVCWLPSKQALCLLPNIA